MSCLCELKDGNRIEFAIQKLYPLTATTRGERKWLQLSSSGDWWCNSAHSIVWILLRSFRVVSIQSTLNNSTLQPVAEAVHPLTTPRLRAKVKNEATIQGLCAANNPRVKKLNGNKENYFRSALNNHQSTNHESDILVGACSISIYFYVWKERKSWRFLFYADNTGNYEEWMELNGMGKEIINMADSSNKSHNYLLDVVPLK